MKLPNYVVTVARRKGLADKSIDAYCFWIRRYLTFAARQYGEWKNPTELFTQDVEAFLNHLVMEERLSGSSQNQGLNALVFLYKHVLADAIPSDHLGKFELLRSRRVARVPTVLSVEEVRRVIDAMPDQGNYRLMVKLLYGTGLRISECCTLRVRDIDFGRGTNSRPL